MAANELEWDMSKHRSDAIQGVAFVLMMAIVFSVLAGTLAVKYSSSDYWHYRHHVSKPCDDTCKFIKEE